MNEEIRLGEFDKWGYKNSFSKGELARELVYMNRDYKQLQQENQQLKTMICPIYEKCQKGECDCTHEEYNSMCETNMKMSVELNEYKSINEKAMKYIIENGFLDLNGYDLFGILNIENYKELEEGKEND